MPTRTVVGFGFLGSLRPRWPQLRPAPGLQGGGPGQASPPTSELSAANWPLTSPSSVFLCASVCLSVLPAQPGLPPLLSLLLCVVPSKAAHLTYEPAWQLPPGELPVGLTSATSLSFSRQVMALERGHPPPHPLPASHSACAPGQPASCTCSLLCAHTCVSHGSQLVPTCPGGYLQGHSSTVPPQGGSEGLRVETPE